MREYNVFDGTYPFENLIGQVSVPVQEEPDAEAALALDAAVHLFGGHPVVAPQ